MLLLYQIKIENLSVEADYVKVSDIIASSEEEKYCSILFKDQIYCIEK